MSHLLFLSQLLPYPPDAGPKVRAYYLLRYLSQKHRLTLLAFTRPDDTSEAIEHLRSFCQAVHTVPIRRSRLNDARFLLLSMLAGQPFAIRRDFSPAMAQKIDRLLASRDFDAVHADQLWMAQYALRALRLIQSSESPLRLILDEHNACFRIFQRLARSEKDPLRRWLLEREWRALKRYESRACSRFHQVVTVTKEDRITLENLVYGEDGRPHGEADHPCAYPQFTTIPICVDVQANLPIRPIPNPKDILHLGTMFWLPNVEGILWFAREAWPLVRERVPEASFTIVGKSPPSEIRALSRNHSGLYSAPSSEGPSSIHVTGYVPNPLPYLQKAGVFIVPLLSGSGMRVKILDAWSWGLPVVSTTIGVEGIHHRDGENILIADEPEAFAQAVVRVLCDADLAGRMRENGRRWVEQHYDWRQVYPAWEAIYPPDGYAS